MTLANITSAGLIDSDLYNNSVQAWLTAHPGYFLCSNDNFFWTVLIVAVSSMAITYLVMRSDKIIGFLKEKKKA